MQGLSNADRDFGRNAEGYWKFGHGRIDDMWTEEIFGVILGSFPRWHGASTVLAKL